MTKYSKPIHILGDITPESAMITVQQLYSQHISLDRHTPILLIINSKGGDVYSGLSIIDAIEDILNSRQVHTHIMGRAMSMALLVAITGSYRTITEHSMTLLHKPTNMNMLKFTSELENDTFKVYLKLIKHLQSHSLMDDLPTYDLLLDAQETLNRGLVDEVTNSPLAMIKE